jgi:hypothetical protein
MVLVRTNVSQELILSITRLERISKQEQRYLLLATDVGCEEIV